MILMDLSRAFDCIPYTVLISKLRAYGCSPDVCNYILSYYCNRKQHVKIGKKKLLKLPDIMSYVNVVNMGWNAEMQDRCRGREAWVTTKSIWALNILRSWQIRAKYNENVINWLSTVNSSVDSVWYRRVCDKIRENKDRWLLIGPRTFRPTL